MSDHRTSVAAMRLLKVAGLSDRQADVLATQHEGPERRYYHTWQHALDVAGRAFHAGLGRSGVTAGLFHDCVYKVGSQDNEAQSIAAMCQMVDVDPEAVAMVAATAKHSVSSWTHGFEPEVEVFLDCDILSIAESDWDKAVQTDLNVTRELFEHYGEAALLGRRAYLEEWLRKPSIFLSKHFAEHEWQARRNIYRLLDVKHAFVESVSGKSKA